MKARALIASACYGPATLKILWKAFDDAWEEIASGIGPRLEAIEAARYQLASTILSLANNGCALDAERLTATAVQLMRANLMQFQPRKLVN